jgi:hypothetical protein
MTQQRGQIIFDRIYGFLNAYRPPRGQSPEQNGKLINAITDALVVGLPSYEKTNDLEMALAQLFERVAAAQSNRAWPSQQRFLTAMPGRNSRRKGQETYAPDHLKFYAKQMNAGDGVCELAVWGYASADLVAEGLVSRQVIEDYRMGYVAQSKEAYRSKHAALKFMRAKFGTIVSPYFEDAEGTHLDDRRGRA